MYIIFETATCFLIFFCVIPGRHFPENSSLNRTIHGLTREFRVKFHAKNRYRTRGKYRLLHVKSLISLLVCVICLSLRLRQITQTSDLIGNGNRTKWSPIRSVIILVINKSDSHCAVVRFCYHSYDYRPYTTT